MTTTRDWSTVVATLGRDMRALRIQLGLSQAQLAQRAGTSQGLISRFERSGSIDLPLLSFIKVIGALAESVRGIDGIVSPSLHRLLDVIVTLDRIDARSLSAPPSDPQLAELVHAYHLLPTVRRPAFVAMVSQIASYIGDDPATAQT